MLHDHPELKNQTETKGRASAESLTTHRLHTYNFGRIRRTYSLKLPSKTFPVFILTLPTPFARVRRETDSLPRAAFGGVPGEQSGLRFGRRLPV
jgi:hypothetical protein